jgi:hypothetical protein
MVIEILLSSVTQSVLLAVTSKQVKQRSPKKEENAARLIHLYPMHLTKAGNPASPFLHMLI